MRTVIKYEDRHIIVAYKPAGLATQTSRVGQADMVSELKNYLKGGYLGVVHRLDQPVEGLLVFAKTREAAAALTGQLEKGILNKQYYAVVCGKPKPGTGELVDYLCKTADNRAEVVDAKRAKEKGAKEARLQFEVLAESDGTEMSLLRIQIETGRFHQIRAQLSHAGFPILGDAKYGTDLSGRLGRERGVRNVALCACELELVHPADKRKLVFRVVPQGELFHCFPICYAE